jgi:pullulanase
VLLVRSIRYRSLRNGEALVMNPKVSNFRHLFQCFSHWGRKAAVSFPCLTLVMIKKLMTFCTLVSIQVMGQGVNNYMSYPVYNGKDLGLTYTRSSSLFKLWAPFAEKVHLLFYQDATGGSPLSSISMVKSQKGIWTASIHGDQEGKFYVFAVMRNGKWYNEVPDPYAKLVGINGKRAMVGDLKKTNPSGWNSDRVAAFGSATNAIIYELHVRDASISANSGIVHKGKFLGLTEKGSRNTAGLSTGLDHLVELGITHVHLLPCFDFNSVDETGRGKTYNWGYDPLNYNAPEGSYATDAADGYTRIREFKQLIQALHASGLRVVMDVVYNHTALTEDSYFNQLVPGYYYRQDKNGKFSNATACNNETASERPMMRKFILESMKYWVQEYHVDGFRVDLMGVHDITTMNLVSAELNKIKPGILIYGEGWTAGASPLPDSLRALKSNAAKLDHIAVFSDDIRDGIKGSVFEHTQKGFASGATGMDQSVRFGIVASCPHPQVDYAKVNYSKKPYAKEPYQVITYCECHDNHTLWDKLAISASAAPAESRKQMQKLALSIVLTSQGIAFLHAGTEFLRSKKGVENSFDSPDSINAIDWDLKSANRDVFEYVRALIKMRKEHPAFRLKDAATIKKAVAFDDNTPEGVIVYTIDGATVGDNWKNIMVCFNGTDTMKTVSAEKGNWISFILDNETVSQPLAGKTIELRPHSCSLFYLK